MLASGLMATHFMFTYLEESSFLSLLLSGVLGTIALLLVFIGSEPPKSRIMQVLTIGFVFIPTYFIFGLQVATAMKNIYVVRNEPIIPIIMALTLRHFIFYGSMLGYIFSIMFFVSYLISANKEAPSLEDADHLIEK